MPHPEHHPSNPGYEGTDYRAETPPDPNTQIFSVTGFSRNDLQERLKFTDDEIGQLDDAAMYRIAQIIEDHYVEVSFWSDLDFAARHTLQERQKQQRRSDE
jgi:hypothetical protein